MPSVSRSQRSRRSRSGPSPESIALPPSVSSSPSGRTILAPVTWLTVNPFFRQGGLARVLGEAAADRAHLLARRVGRVEVLPRQRRVTSRFVTPGSTMTRSPARSTSRMRFIRVTETTIRPRPGALRRRGRLRRARRTEPRHASRAGGPPARLLPSLAARLQGCARHPVSLSQSYCPVSLVGLGDDVRIAQCLAKLVDEAEGKRHGAILLRDDISPEQDRSSMIAGFVRVAA